ncbi:MAG: hypothetical protein RL755_417 [Pseudomonadota bacterium]
MIRFIKLILIVMLMTVSISKADTLDVAKVDRASISLTTHLGILEDAEKSLTFESIQKDNIQFKTNLPASESINLSYTKSAFWLRLNIDNSSNQLIERILEINHPLIENLDFYWQIDKRQFKTIHTGYGQPFENRAYKTRVFAFPLQLQAHSQNIIYLRISSPNAISIPVRLWKTADFHVKDRSDYVFQGAYFGILVTIAIFSLAMALVLKEINYVIYVSIIFFTAMGFIAFRGLGSEFIWQDYPELTKVGALFFATLVTIAQLFFVCRILDVRTMLPRLYTIITGLIFLQSFMSIFVVLQFDMAAKYTAYAFGFYPLFVLVISFIGVIKRKSSALFLFTGFLVLAIGFVTSVLHILALVATNIFTMYSSQICSAIELLIFALLLTDRYQLIHVDKLKSDKNLVEINLKLLAEIEERKVSEKRQAELTHQLYHMQKLESIGRLTSGIAHDFNNLLMAISGYNELNKLSAQDLTENRPVNIDHIQNELMENSKQIDTACYKAKKLISQMLSYCRRDQSEAIENPVFNINNELCESLDMIRKMIPSSIHFELNLSDKIIPIRQLDEANFNQIIVNLSVNAAHAIADAKGSIKFHTGQVNLNSVCSCCREKFSGKFVEISVSDDGAGIDPVVVERIFEPFFTTKEVGEGTGLGLSVIAGVVHNADGHILLESKVGEGTTFRLLFPYQ